MTLADSFARICETDLWSSNDGGMSVHFKTIGRYGEEAVSAINGMGVDDM